MTYHLRSTSQYQNQRDKSSFSVYGESVVSGGLCVQNGISGAGLITTGFLWEGYEIWLWPEDSSPVSTSWGSANGYSGSASLIVAGWTAAVGYSGSASLVSTAWNFPPIGMNGEFPA